VFCEPDSTGCDYRKVGAAFRAAVKDAEITSRSRLSLHSLRHSFASLLIANGLNVVFVSRQLGHAKPTTTLAVYAHLFDQAEHAHTARAALEASYQTLSARTPTPADAGRSAETAVGINTTQGQRGTREGDPRKGPLSTRRP
jgi:hypothetical protein